MEEPTPEPTTAEIKAEVDKFIKGQPSKLTVTDVPPRIIAPIPAKPSPAGYVHVEAEYDAHGNLIFKDIDEGRENGGWKNTQHQRVEFQLPPASSPVTPPGYTESKPVQYDAAGTLIIED